ncbi:hypothetical protein FEM48_Zijuj06G0004900 [Ziziphus jujuba var. spinosa]|uniref:MLO-like protein n=1 Tax=Ziziphus jujuba var. spinosa TaxID=714518 RepID=A0A978V647_ZIZJJ|nr:hypothetical protein FEM48_Zijuj06G0004900 [Ziziphus jujuba var. spinosa]
MAGGGGDHGGGHTKARELDQTPTWAVAAVCAVIIIISILLEKVLHMFGEWFQKRKKKALYEALEKVKGELMVLGFISLLLTFGQTYIAKICIRSKYGDTMLPCSNRSEAMSETGDHESESGGEEHHRRLLWYQRRFLSAGGESAECKPGHVPLISVNGLHQLHIFIFFLAVFHVIYSAITMALGRLKIRGWKEWERETTQHQEFMNDPSRFRLTHETSFVKDHTRIWTKTPVTFYFVCLFRQFFRSVRKADYLTMRHGFVHLAPGSRFDFQKYIKRSLEDDFKVVVGISPLLWAAMVLFLLLNVHGWEATFWLSLLPLVVILAVGTKLQAIITRMALEIQERHAVVQGIPLVQVSDRHFWFSWPELSLYLIHFVLFQYEFGLRSCFHEDFGLVIFRVVLGVVIQFVCSYITLPLYALVTQRSIFDDQTSKALKNWRKNAAGGGKRKADEKVRSPPAVLGGSPTDSSPVHTPVGGPRSVTHGQGDGLSDMESNSSSGPNHTANIMASVDLQGKQQQQQPPSPNNSSFPYAERDLLSGV